MDPQQRLFSYLLITLRARGYDVYDGAMPPDGTPYPFIYLGETEQEDVIRKNEIRGNVYQTIHVYHNNLRERGRLSVILMEIKTMCRALEAGSGWLITECSSRILPDTTTKEPLMHGIVEVGFKF